MQIKFFFMLLITLSTIYLHGHPLLPITTHWNLFFLLMEIGYRWFSSLNIPPPKNIFFLNIPYKIKNMDTQNAVNYLKYWDTLIQIILCWYTKSILSIRQRLRDKLRLRNTLQTPTAYLYTHIPTQTLLTIQSIY